MHEVHYLCNFFDSLALHGNIDYMEEKRERQCRQTGLNRDILKELCRELEISETSDLKTFAWLVPVQSHILSDQSFRGKTHSYCSPQFITAVWSGVTFLL